MEQVSLDIASSESHVYYYVQRLEPVLSSLLAYEFLVDCFEPETWKHAQTVPS